MTPTALLVAVGAGSGLLSLIVGALFGFTVGRWGRERSRVYRVLAHVFSADQTPRVEAWSRADVAELEKRAHWEGEA